MTVASQELVKACLVLVLYRGSPCEDAPELALAAMARALPSTPDVDPVCQVTQAARGVLDAQERRRELTMPIARLRTALFQQAYEDLARDMGTLSPPA